MWLCASNGELGGSASVTRKARAWKAGTGNSGDPDWVRFAYRVFLQVLTLVGEVYCYSEDVRSQYAHDRFVPTWTGAVGTAR